MVKTCSCFGCTNTAAAGYRTHMFPDRKKYPSAFRAWVRFVKMRRKDFSASSVTARSMICGAHFTHADYKKSDLMAKRVGFKGRNVMRLIRGAVPSVHPARKKKKETVSAAVRDKLRSVITKRRLLKTQKRDDASPARAEDQLSVDPLPHSDDWAKECHQNYIVPPTRPPPDETPDTAPSPDNAPSPPGTDLQKRSCNTPAPTDLPTTSNHSLSHHSLVFLIFPIDVHTIQVHTSSSATDCWQSEMKVKEEDGNCRPRCDADNCKAQSCSLEQEFGALRAENRSLKMSKADLNESFFQNNDGKVLMLTGLPTYSILRALFDTVLPHLKLKQALTPFHQFLLTLMKLRLDLSFDFLAFFFKVDPTTIASELFKHCVTVMYYRLVPSLIIWPDRAMLRKTLPIAFRHSYFEKAACIVDCFEMKIEKQQATTDDSHHVLKYLIAFSPQGSVFFISNGRGGDTSDKSIIENSHFLPNLLPGDLVLADSGLNIDQSIQDLEDDFNIPAFTRGEKQLEPVCLKSTESLEPFRTQIRKVVGVVREKYAFLQSAVPVTLTDTNGENVTCLDKIVKICCALTNVCGFDENML